MSFLGGILTSLGKWILTNLWTALAAWAKALWAKKKDENAVQKNETDLQTAIKSGDKDAIDKAATDGLNNIGGS